MLDQSQLLRYSKQIILKDIGVEGQQKLLSSKVLVAGAGGLGSPILYYLAAAGVGTIGLADFDQVGISNLQRQILHWTEDIGRMKVDSAGEKLTRLNPDTNIVKHPCRLNLNNIEAIISGYDIVIDGTDNITSRYLISDCCYFMNKPLVEGAVIGFEGILMTIIPGETPCYRCLYPYPPKDGVLPSCSDVGILGMTAGVIGSLQALEAVKQILSLGAAPAGRLLTFNGLNMEFNNIDIPKNQTCPLCGEKPSITELEEYEVRCRRKDVTRP